MCCALQPPSPVLLAAARPQLRGDASQPAGGQASSGGATGEA